MSMAGRQKTQSSTSWRTVINGTKANVVLEKYTIQYNIQKSIQTKRRQEAKSAKRKLKFCTVPQFCIATRRKCDQVDIMG